MSSDRLVYPGAGVLVASEGTPQVTAIRWAMLSDTRTVKVKWANGKVEHFEASEVTQDPRTDTMMFVSNGVTYTIRELRDADGRWLSSLHTTIPVHVLETLVQEGDNTVAEKLIAYALDDSPYVVGLVYQGGGATYGRVGASWVMLAADDTTFEGENVFAIEIDPEKADDYIDLFDKNYVTVTDTEKYESADPESEEGSEQSDE